MLLSALFSSLQVVGGLVNSPILLARSLKALLNPPPPDTSLARSSHPWTASPPLPLVRMLAPRAGALFAVVKGAVLPGRRVVVRTGEGAPETKKSFTEKQWVFSKCMGQCFGKCLDGVFWQRTSPMV